MSSESPARRSASAQDVDPLHTTYAPSEGHQSGDMCGHIHEGMKKAETAVEASPQGVTHFGLALCKLATCWHQQRKRNYLTTGLAFALSVEGGYWRPARGLPSSAYITALISSMKTSHKRYCQKSYMAVVALHIPQKHQRTTRSQRPFHRNKGHARLLGVAYLVKLYASMFSTTCSIALFKRLRIHRQPIGNCFTSRVVLGTKSSPRFMIANRMAFHNLLHHMRYPTAKQTNGVSNYTATAIDALARCASVEGQRNLFSHLQRG